MVQIHHGSFFQNAFCVSTITYVKKQTKDTAGTGAISTLMIAGAIRQTGRAIFLPFSEEKDAIDLIFKDTDQKLKTVQCKTGRMINGSIDFQCRRTNGKRKREDGTVANVRRPYSLGEFDFFGVYCPENGNSYLVEATADILSHSRAYLRIETPRNTRTTSNLRWAVDFKIPYILDGPKNTLPSDIEFADFKTRLKPVCEFCGKKRIKRIGSKYCSHTCNGMSQQTADKPSKEELEQFLCSMTKFEIGTKFNVTETCINLWIKNYGIIAEINSNN